MGDEKAKGKFVVVSNRLPFYRKKDKKGDVVWKKASGGLIAAMEPIVNQNHGVWVGWDGFTDAVDQQASLTKASKLIPQSKGEYRICCLPISKQEVEGYYDHFSNGTLWALFHYFFEKSSIDYKSWGHYKEVNHRFAAYVDQIASKGAIVWIQDYHLFLVPKLLKELRPDLQIHFFLHIPFPHIDIFSILPWKDQIVDSLTLCDAIGFHRKQYLRNFESALDGAKTNARLFANPISVDFEHIDAVSRRKDVIERAEEVRGFGGCPKVIIGVDRMDYSKGIKERLLGIELLLEEHPELHEQFFYYQLVVPSREKVESYSELRREVDELVGRINGRFGTETWYPVNYHYGTLGFDDLIAHYLAADIALVTPLRDGMNLVCKEYIAAHSDDDGVLILSKFAGAFAELKQSIAINPYSIKEIKEAIIQAIHMSKEERVERMKKMRSTIANHTLQDWVEKCFE